MNFDTVQYEPPVGCRTAGHSRQSATTWSMISRVICGMVTKWVHFKPPGATRSSQKVPRALIGNTLAEQLMYPPDSSFGTLLIFRMQERYQRLLARLGRRSVENSNFTRFTSLLEASVLEETGISYRLPDHMIRRSLPSGRAASVGTSCRLRCSPVTVK